MKLASTAGELASSAHGAYGSNGTVGVPNVAGSLNLPKALRKRLFVAATALNDTGDSEIFEM